MAAETLASTRGCRTKPFRKHRCTFAEVHARATVRGDLATDGPTVTNEMAVFGAHP